MRTANLEHRRPWAVTSARIPYRRRCSRCPCAGLVFACSRHLRGRAVSRPTRLPSIPPWLQQSSSCSPSPRVTIFPCRQSVPTSAGAKAYHWTRYSAEDSSPAFRAAGLFLSSRVQQYIIAIDFMINILFISSLPKNILYGCHIRYHRCRTLQDWNR